MNNFPAHRVRVLTFAVALTLLAPFAQAYQADEAVKKPVEEAAEAPAKVTKRVKFVADNKPTVTFKQRLEVYNRAKHKEDQERLYCREDRVTGSHRKKIRCVTQYTRKLEEQAARDFLRYARN
ncbi:MAG: hypothetical protein AB8G17_09955 [Gammaproteobacteria bacterium]